eukprot:GHVR01018042.1.p1 GENE.GHVR01018042.1~~GHVR01018042.1.p1  ORF type:complete len:100 (+),score=55.55 GHVR01018042.1:178-477(+)
MEILLRLMTDAHRERRPTVLQLLSIPTLEILVQSKTGLTSSQLQDWQNSRRVNEAVAPHTHIHTHTHTLKPVSRYGGGLSTRLPATNTHTHTHTHTIQI